MGTPLARRAAHALPAVAMIAAVTAGCGPRPSEPAARSREWPAYLGGDDRAQYSLSTEITPENVARLEVAWTYGAGGADSKNRSQIQCNPIVIDGVLFGISPSMAAFALDASTGEEIWRFDPFPKQARMVGTSRGLTYWNEGRSARVFFAAGERLWSLDAASGRPIPAFGEDGSIDLRVGLPASASDLMVRTTTPGVVYRDLFILGTRVAESLPAAPGDVRAFDVESGALVWTFHTIPERGEPGSDTWPADARATHGGANAWAGMSLDRERGIVYVPTGSAAYDFYGGDRPGANLYANSLLALEAATGKLLWHRQLVHHDIWDRDLPAPPNLVTIDRDGRAIAAVAQITKSGHVFLFDRVTGEPLHPIEEHAVPASDLEGESEWPTQPLPVRPPPFARQSLSEENLTRRTAEAHAAVLERFRRLRSGGQFVPPSREGTVILPGFDGGGEWGGAAWDPESGLLYANASEMPWILTMVSVDALAGAAQTRGAMLYAQHCVYCHGVDRAGDPLGVHPGLIDLRSRQERSETRTIIRDGRRGMPAFAHLSDDQLTDLVELLHSDDNGANASASDATAAPRSTTESSALEQRLHGSAGRRFSRYVHTGYNRFLDPDGYPAIAPPWGTLTAIDLARGELLWQVTLGDLPQARASDDPPTGAENYGGPVVTAGGLVFIAATKDEKLRAFDKRTGALLWTAQLPAGGYATPAIYEAGGRQFIVIAAGGGKMGTPSGDSYVAYRLP